MSKIISCLLVIAAVSFFWSCCGECPEETREKIQSEAADKLAALDAQIAKLSALAAEAGQDAKEELDKAVGELKTMYEQAKVQLQELKEVGEEKWEEASSAMSSTLESLDQRFTEIWAKFGE
jgi:hypothetical protein